MRGAAGTRRAAWWWLLALWLGATGAPARADSSFVLELRAPAGQTCIDGATLSAALEARVGRSAQPMAAVVRVGVEIEAVAHGYRAQVSIDEARRDLTVEGACSQLDEMLVVVIASSLGVAPARAQDKPRPRPSPHAQEHAQDKLTWQLDLPRAAAVPETAHASRERTSHTPLRLDLDASARLLTGVMPQPSVGPGLALQAQWGSLGVNAGGVWLPSDSYASEGAARLRLRGGLAQLGVCGRAVGAARLEALFCAELWAGALHAAAEPLGSPQARWDVLLLLVPRAEGRLLLAPSLGVSLALGAAIPLVFPRYEYGSTAGGRVVAHAPELGLLVTLALWLRILP